MWVSGCVVVLTRVKMGGCVWKRVRDRGTEDSFCQVETQVILVQQFFFKKNTKNEGDVADLVTNELNV